MRIFKKAFLRKCIIFLILGYTPDIQGEEDVI